MRTGVPYRYGNYYVDLPNQLIDRVACSSVVKSGFVGYRMWRRRYDPTFSGFYAGGNMAPFTQQSGVNEDGEDLGSVYRFPALKVDMQSGTVQGSVFGGGRGGTATVTVHENATDPVTHVHIRQGTISGNVYGGGNDAKVVGNTKVVIGE